jgi:hypothetical protein
LTAEEVAVLPVESTTRAVKATFPALVGNHVAAHGATVSVNMIADPARNWTCVTVAPGVATGSAVKLTAFPTVMTAPGNGAVSETDAASAALTVMETADEVAVAPLLSVTRAVSEVAPVAVGAQEIENGSVVSVPMTAEPAKKSTFEIPVPPECEPVAESVIAVPTLAVDPAAGAVSETVGPATVTLTTDDVAVVPFESVARAVSAVTPAVVGVQENEYGDVKAVPTTVPPARKSTFVMLGPPATEAVAVNVVAAPSESVAPPLGAVSETEGVTLTTETVTVVAFAAVAPFESVTRLESVNVPVEDGTHVAS